MNSFFHLFCVQFIVILCYSSADNNNNDVFESAKQETVYIYTVHSESGKVLFSDSRSWTHRTHFAAFKCFGLASFLLSIF